MENAPAAPSAPTGYSKIAHPVHTVILLVALAVWAYTGRARADHLRDAADAHRLLLYTRTLIFEWLLLAFVLLGVRLNGSPVETVLGGCWRSIREFARDFGIGVAFLLVSFVIAAAFGSHGRDADSNRALQFLFPVNGTEKMMWAALSLTAGICEEAIMRGYLQRQFTALTSSLTAGIILQALVFGAAHAYQGLRRAIPIAVLGVIWGVLAHWRKTVRPGMITHALQDMSVLLLRH